MYTQSIDILGCKLRRYGRYVCFVGLQGFLNAVVLPLPSFELTAVTTELSAVPRPILVLGMARRTGTNFLGGLLKLHPDCTGPQSIYEDFLVSGVDSLENYVTAVSGEWDHKWDPDGSIASHLRGALGAGVEGFIRAESHDPQKRPVFKTPSVEGLRSVDQYFPGSDIVILVRYGPAVVESGMRSFKWKFETACEKWGDAARLVVEVLAEHDAARTSRLTVVRYEDLFTTTNETLMRLFDRLGLNADRYDFDKAEAFPVLGSSTNRGGIPKVHWKPVKKTADFNPLARAAHWSAKKLERFDRLTGHVSADLGYELQATSGLRRFFNR